MLRGKKVRMGEKVKFGSQKVEKSDKIKLVSNIFSSVANKYDIMNDAMSFGLHRQWKNRMLSISKLKNNDTVLDIATGTGDIALKLLMDKKNINITCLDENKEMLDICKDRFIDNSFLHDIKFICSPIENAELKDNSFSLVTIAFGFRNFTDHKKALSRIFNALSPGGRLVIMEFTTPKNQYLKAIFEKYTHKIIPNLGKYIANDYDSYKYLAESISSYFEPSEVSEMFEKAGFIKTRYEKLPGDIVTIHIGYKC